MFTYFMVMSIATGFVKSMPQLRGSDDSSENEVNTYNFPIVSRTEWNARTPKAKLPLVTPVPYVVIHHSYDPGPCITSSECHRAMSSMQDYHMNNKTWWDIGYNFAIGGDGAAYEGRGWEVLGAHALHFNTISIGICLIGDWRNDLPPPGQIKTAKALIETGVKLGYIQNNYKLVGHRQVRDTECPGDALFENIQKWSHYSSFPRSVTDLPNVEELPENVKKDLSKNITH